MEVSVADAADALGVSRVRVRQLIDAGRVRARKVGGIWLVDGASLPSASRRVRPMSPAVARQFVEEHPQGLSPQEAYRRRLRRDRLAHDPEPARLLADWLAARARREVYRAREPLALLDDPAIIPSGLSDSRSGMSAADIVEGYVSHQDLPVVLRHHLLRPGGSDSNVILHVVDELPSDPVPPLVLAADLADHDGPRELARAEQIIRAVLAS